MYKLSNFFAALLLVVAIPTQAADYHVQRNGVEQFCATAVTVAGTTYNFTGTCSTPPPPAGQWTRGNINYPPRGGTAVNADTTLWENFFGRTGAAGTPVAFPGLSGATPQFSPTRGTYVAMKFTVPPGTHSGQYKLASYYSINNVDVSLSSSPGLFGPVTTACNKVNQQATDQPFLFWDTGTVGTFKCHLLPGATYYLNVKPRTLNDYGNIGMVHQGA